MSSRSKKMVALATLNAELQWKKTVFRSQVPQRSKKDIDPDYSPVIESDADNESDLSEISNSGEIQEENRSVDNIWGENQNIELNNLIESENPNIDENPYESEEDIIKSILSKIINKAVLESEKFHQKKYTKRGTIRKRKIFEEPLTARKKRKFEEKATKHPVKPPCSEKCRRKCPKFIDMERQNQINQQFWKMANLGQRAFLLACFKRCAKQKKTFAGESRRGQSFKYCLNDIDGKEFIVCKTFLLSTLGFHPANDRILKSVRDTDSTCITPKKDMRGRHPNKSKIDTNLIKEHIRSFRPVISHYRREHAPNRLYLSSDISVTLMHRCFVEKYPNFKVSYELYRKQIAEMNISFAKLGNEECFECEKYNLHLKNSDHNKEDPSAGCEECKIWEEHEKRYLAAREEYKKDGKEKVSETLIVSADLQKVKTECDYFIQY